MCRIGRKPPRNLVVCCRGILNAWERKCLSRKRTASVIAKSQAGHAINGLGDFDLTAAGEIAPSLAAILAFADKPTNMIGIGHLRGHETNRLEALVNEITRIGGEARELPDGLKITPVSAGCLRPAVMETYADHRMATFAAMLGLRIKGIQVENIAATAKTLPNFVNMWNDMLA